MHPAYAVPAFYSLAGQFIDYVIFPLIVIGFLGFVAWARTMNRRQNTTDTALAVVLKEVDGGEGTPSLRELVTQTRIDQAEVRATLRAALDRPR